MVRVLFFCILSLFFSFESLSDSCESYYGDFSSSREDRQEARQILERMGFTGYMRDFIGGLGSHVEARALSGQQKINLWREAVIAVRAKQGDFVARELSFHSNGIRGTAFVGSIASSDLRTTIVFLHEPMDGKFFTFTTPVDLVELTKRGARASGKVEHLSEKEMGDAQFHIFQQLIPALKNAEPEILAKAKAAMAAQLSYQDLPRAVAAEAQSIYLSALQKEISQESDYWWAFERARFKMHSYLAEVEGGEAPLPPIRKIKTAKETALDRALEGVKPVPESVFHKLWSNSGGAYYLQIERKLGVPKDQIKNYVEGIESVLEKEFLQRKIMTFIHNSPS